MESKNQEVVKQDKSEMVYSVAGQEIKLSLQIVRSYLTKGSGKVSDTEIIQFMAICKYNQLNPFLNEAYLVKYGDEPATMVTSKEAFFKRADACDKYEGYESGIIVQRGDEILELEGAFMHTKDILLGGWAKVYRSDKKHPIVVKVMLGEYIQRKKDGTPNRFWKEKPATMICKVAKAQVHREAFPSQLGAMYTPDEVQDIDYEEIKKEEVKKEANKTTFAENVEFETCAPENKEKKELKQEPKQEPEQKTLDSEEKQDY